MANVFPFAGKEKLFSCVLHYFILSFQGLASFLLLFCAKKSLNWLLFLANAPLFLALRNETKYNQSYFCMCPSGRLMTGNATFNWLFAANSLPSS